MIEKYLSLGWHIFPIFGMKDGKCQCHKEHLCPHPGKHPIEKGGYKEASNDPEKIKAWQEKYPGCNWAVAAGEKSGLIVLDIDKRNGGFSSIDEFELPETAQVHTGGDGSHYYFKYTDHIPKTVLNALPGVDIISNKFSVILPPSLHKSGKEYQWLLDQAPWEIELSPPPKTVLDLCHQKLEPEQPKGSNEETSIPEGGRNQFMTSIAGRMRSQGYSAPVIVVELRRQNERCNPPLPDEELVQIAKSIERYDTKEKVETSLRLGREIARDYNIRYCPQSAQFFIYQDGYYAEKTVEDIHDIIIHTPDGPKMKGSFRTRVIENIKVVNRVNLEDINADHYFNFTNGLYDFKKQKLIPHSKDIMNTIRIPYAFDENAQCPLWLEKMDDIFSTDKNKIIVLQDYFGYCLTKETKFEKALFLIGSGQNGKGVVTNTLMNMVGKQNCSAITLNEMSDAAGRAPIMNKLINIMTEVSKRSVDFESAFRTIVSGEPVIINDKYVKRFQYEPFCKLVFAINELPRIDDMSHGFYRRMVIIPFTNHYPPDKCDFDLKDKLLKELPGIFNWSLQGLKRLLSRPEGFLQTIYMKREIESVRAANNPLGTFFEDVIELYPEGIVEKYELYIAYKKWALENGYIPLSSGRFNLAISKVFEENKIFTVRSRYLQGKRRSTSWSGIRLTHQPPQGYRSQVERDDSDRPF
jgi:putative DNA primase/helicase